jgi:uncharacterized membrane protein
MNTHARQLTLFGHITTSVGWMGAVAAFLTLALTGLNGQDAERVRAAYLAMEPITWYIIVPLSFASLLTGLALAVGTRWGLLRHFWIIIKLLINVLSIVLLLLHTGMIHEVASAAAKTNFSVGDLRGSRVHLVTASSAALAALLFATMLSVFKPRGMTR